VPVNLQGGQLCFDHDEFGRTLPLLAAPQPGSPVSAIAKGEFFGGRPLVVPVHCFGSQQSSLAHAPGQKLPLSQPSPSGQKRRAAAVSARPGSLPSIYGVQVPVPGPYMRCGSLTGRPRRLISTQEQKAEFGNQQLSVYNQRSIRCDGRHQRSGSQGTSCYGDVIGSCGGAKAGVKHKKESVRRINVDMLEHGGFFDMPILVRPFYIHIVSSGYVFRPVGILHLFYPKVRAIALLPKHAL
jgi:hypothetical protein